MISAMPRRFRVAMAMAESSALMASGAPALVIATARAQTQSSGANYPERQVSFIVPFAPAGGTDILARLLAQKLEQRFGKPFVVENRPGAGTVLATNFLAHSPPDGYTIMMAVSSLAADVTLYKSLPYNPANDFVLVALIARVPFVLVVNPSLAVNNVEDLIKLAKQRTLSYGSGGVGAFHHLAAALFASMAGIKMTHVPYRGTAPALNDLMAGYIQVLFADYGPASPLIASGKVRALAVTTKQPFAVLPAIVAKLNSGLNAAVATNEVQTKMRDIGMIPVGTGSPEELAEFFHSEIVRWGKVVEDAGIARSE